MQFVSAVSLETEPERIVQDVRDQLGPALGFDLAAAFVRPERGDAAARVLEELRGGVEASHFIGCTAGGVIGAGREIETGAAATVLAARLPGVEIEPLSALYAGESARSPDDIRACLALLDPFSTSAEALLRRLERAAPGVKVVGGVASWGQAPGQNRLAQNDVVTDAGAVGVTLRGGVQVSTVVSQGCRPVGDWFTVTSSQGNVIHALDDEPPLAALERVFTQASRADQERMQAGILIGRAISSSPDQLGHGSFVVRGVLGAIKDSGAISVADRVREGAVVQFHVRDAQSARDDLEMLLTPQAFEDPAAGALLFTCNGRGEHFFGRRDVDASIAASALGDSVPVAGFFCAGELGPIGAANFVHGYTASMAVFRPLPPRRAV